MHYSKHIPSVLSAQNGKFVFFCLMNSSMIYSRVYFMYNEWIFLKKFFTSKNNKY